MPTAAFMPRRSSARTSRWLRMPPAAVMGSLRRAPQLAKPGADWCRAWCLPRPHRCTETRRRSGPAPEKLPPGASAAFPASREPGCCPPSVSTATMTRLRPTRRRGATRKARFTLPPRNAALPTMIFSAPRIEDARRRAPWCGCRRPRARAWAPAGKARRTRRALLPFPMAASEIDDMQQRILAEALEQAEDIVDGQAPLAPVHQLHGAAILQIDAGDNHDDLSRVRKAHRERHCCGQKALQVRRGLVWRREKSKPPARRPRGLRRTRRENPRACRRRPRRSPARRPSRRRPRSSARSKPLRVPSRSIEVSKISPAPRDAPSLAHATASQSAGVAAAAHEGFPAVADAFGVNRQHHGLRAKFGGQFGKQLRDAAAPRC